MNTANHTAPDLAALDGDTLWWLLRETADGRRDGLAGQLAQLCVNAGASRLGWVSPPQWKLVERAISAVLAVLHLSTVRPILALSTGGWSFAACAISELFPQARPPLDSLDPARIRRALASADEPVQAMLAVSASRSTLETHLLTQVIAGLTKPRRPQLAWLSDAAGPSNVLPLSPRGALDQVAMLGAPLSTAFLIAAEAAGAGIAPAYASLLSRYDQIGLSAVRLAALAPASGSPFIRFVTPPWTGHGLRLWLLQLGRQVLCGKSSSFTPRIELGDPAQLQAPSEVRLDVSGLPRSLSALMELLYVSGVFVAALALRAGLPVASHAYVGAYKDRLTLARKYAHDLHQVRTVELPDVAASWLTDRPELTRLHVVRYDPGREAGSAAFTRATGRLCEVHVGSAWNHHSFHAVYADPGTATLVAVAPPDTAAAVPVPLQTAARAQREIGIATWMALAERAMIVQLSPEASGEGAHYE